VIGLDLIWVQGKRARPLSLAVPPGDAADYNLFETEWKRFCEKCDRSRDR
jgi:hypothetical protein